MALSECLMTLEYIDGLRFEGLGAVRRKVLALSMAIALTVFNGLANEWPQLSALPLQRGVALDLIVSE